MNIRSRTCAQVGRASYLIARPVTLDWRRLVSVVQPEAVVTRVDEGVVAARRRGVVEVRRHWAATR